MAAFPLALALGAKLRLKLMFGFDAVITIETSPSEAGRAHWRLVRTGPWQAAAAEAQNTPLRYQNLSERETVILVSGYSVVMRAFIFC